MRTFGKAQQERTRPQSPKACPKHPKPAKAIAQVKRMLGRAAGPKELHYAACRWQGMTKQDHLDRVWDIIERVGVCVLTTRFAGGLRARPLQARPDRTAGIIWFVTDLRSSKEHEIESEHDVGLVFVDAKANAYLSITARADVRRDPAKAAEIWKATDDTWWQGPDDPNVCVLRVHPLTAELWDGPSSNAVAAFEFVKAQLTGEKPNLGENRKVTVSM
jgi:general stress protein 26